MIGRTKRFTLPGRTVAQLAAVLLPLVAAAVAGVVVLHSQPAKAQPGHTPATFEMTQTPPKNANGWNNTPVSVEVCASSETSDVYAIDSLYILNQHRHTNQSDGRVGPDTDCMDFIYDFEVDDSDTFQAKFIDFFDADICCSVRSQPIDIRIDMTPPVLVYKPYLLSQVQGLDTTPGGQPAGPPIAEFFGVWQTQRAAVFIMCMDVPGGSDVMSGVDTNTYPSRINFPNDGNFVFNPPGECRDKAGNLATEPVVGNVMIDTRQPTCSVAFNQKAKHGVAKLIRTTVSGTDATSGVFSRQVTAISSLVGVAVAEFTLRTQNLDPAGALHALSTPPVLPAASPLDATYTGASGRTWTLTGKVTDVAGNSRSCTGKLISIR